MKEPLPEGAQLCAFWVGAEEYALDIRRVEEILQPVMSTAIPNAPDLVEGVVSLRRGVIPVVDLHRRLGSGTAPKRAKPKLLVCRVGSRHVALRVDGVSEVLRVQRSDIQPAPRFSGKNGSPYVVGVCGPPERMKLLLDIKALLKSHPGAAS